MISFSWGAASKSRVSVIVIEGLGLGVLSGFGFSTQLSSFFFCMVKTRLASDAFRLILALAFSGPVFGARARRSRFCFSSLLFFGSAPRRSLQILLIPWWDIDLPVFSVSHAAVSRKEPPASICREPPQYREPYRGLG